MSISCPEGHWELQSLQLHWGNGRVHTAQPGQWQSGTATMFSVAFQPLPEDIFLQKLHSTRKEGACLVSCPESNRLFVKYQGRCSCLLYSVPPSALLLSSPTHWWGYGSPLEGQRIRCCRVKHWPAARSKLSADLRYEWSGQMLWKLFTGWGKGKAMWLQLSVCSAVPELGKAVLAAAAISKGGWQGKAGPGPAVATVSPSAVHSASSLYCFPHCQFPQLCAHLSSLSPSLFSFQ